MLGIPAKIIDDIGGNGSETDPVWTSEKTNYYTKEEVDNKTSTIYFFAGSLDNYTDLPISGSRVGEVYRIINESPSNKAGEHFAWEGTQWVSLGKDYVDLSSYYNRNETDTLLDEKQDVLGVNSISRAMIQDNAINGSKVADASLGLTKLALSSPQRMVGNFTDGIAPVTLGDANTVKSFIGLQPLLDAKQNTLQNGDITTNFIADNAVTVNKILNSSVTTDKIVNRSVNNIKLSTMPPKTIKGNKESVDYDATDLEASDVLTLLGLNAPSFIKFSKTFSTALAINNGSTHNLLLDIVLPTDVVSISGRPTTDYSLSSGVLKLPIPRYNPDATYLFEIRLQGTISGSSNTSREFSIQLQRASDSSIVSNKSIIKIEGNSLDNRSALYMSFTKTNTDPFIVGGLQFILNNTSGANISLTGFDFLIEAVN